MQRNVLLISFRFLFGSMSLTLEQKYELIGVALSKFYLYD